MEDIPSALVNILDKTCSPHTLSAESFQWMSAVELLNPFFDWFCNSITEENFVTDDELRCYNHLMKSEKLQSEQELDSKISSYLSQSSGAQVEETSIDGLEEVIHTKERVLNNLKELKNCLYSELNLQEKEKFDSTVDQILQHEIDKVEQVHAEYMKQFHILVEKLDILCENISTLDNAKKPNYICQQNLKQYCTANANLGLNIGILKKKIFEEKHSTTMVSSLKLPISDDDFMNKLFEWMYTEEFSAGLHKAEIYASNEAIRYLSDCEKNVENSNFIFTWNDMKSYNSNVRPTSEELKNTCELFVKDMIRGVQLNICSERLKKRKNRLIMLDTFENIVKTRKLYNDSLHFLLMNDWKIIRTSVSLLQDIHKCWEFNISEFKKRMACMKRHIIKQQMPKTSIDASDTEIENIVCNTLTLDPNASIQDINDSCVVNVNKSILHHKGTISNDFQQYCSSIERIISEVKKIDKFLFDVPTRVVHFNNDIIANLREIDRIVKSISLSDDIQEFDEHQTWLEKNKNLLHMMWYKWNKNPFDVIQTILKLEETARVQKRRHSMLVAQELSSVEFQEYSRF